MTYLKSLDADWFACVSRLNTRGGGRPVLKGREMARRALTVRGMARMGEARKRGILSRNRSRPD